MRGLNLRHAIFIAVAVALSTAVVVVADDRPSGLWVTFDVTGERQDGARQFQRERFRAVVTRPDAVQYVLNFAAGEEPQRALWGRVVAGGRFNEPWGWHLDSASVRFERDKAEDTRCRSGLPSSVKVSSAASYCPQRARVVSVQDCRGSCHRVRGLYAGRSPAF